MTENLTVILLLFILAGIVFIVIKINNKNGQNNLGEIVNSISKLKTETFDPFISSQTEAKGQIDTVGRQMSKLQEFMAGTKRFGQAAEIQLRNILKNSLSKKFWVENHLIEKEGKTLNVEFAVKFPNGSFLPIDAHWPKDLIDEYQQLIKADDLSADHKKKVNAVFSRIITSYSKKCEQIKDKYLQHPGCTNFGIAYCMSEDLVQDMLYYKNDGKDETFLEEMQRENQVVVMGPTSFYLMINSILIGFDQIDADKKASEVLNQLEGLYSLLISSEQELIRAGKQSELSFNSLNTSKNSFSKLKLKLEELKNLNNKGD